MNKPASWEEAMDELVDEKRIVEKALRDVVECWEQSGTPMEIDAVMNRAVVTLKLGE